MPTKTTSNRISPRSALRKSMEPSQSATDSSLPRPPKRGLRRLGLGSSKRKLSFNSRVVHLSDDDDDSNNNSAASSEKQQQQQERHVHFSVSSSSLSSSLSDNCCDPPESPQLTVQTRVFEQEWDETDKALLWWTQEEMAAMSDQTAAICRFHRGEEESGDHPPSYSINNTTEQRLQAMWNLCVKSAVKSRTTGVARAPSNNHTTTGAAGRRRGRDSLTSSIQPIDVQAFWMEDTEEQEESMMTIVIDQEARGLESGILTVLHTKRRQMLEGVLNAQKNLSKSTHPTMRERIVSRTAAHLARASATFAKALGDQDALVAMAQYADDFVSDNDGEENGSIWSHGHNSASVVSPPRERQ